MIRLEKKDSKQVFGILRDGLHLKRVERDFTSTKSKYVFSNGQETQATCFNCADHPCINYRVDEINKSILAGMPHDSSTSVCPTSAIQISTSGKFPVVDESSCINCGICMTRCPFDAIFFRGHRANISRTDHEYYDFSPSHGDDVTLENRLAQFHTSDYLRKLPDINKEGIEFTHNAIQKFNRKLNGFDNLLVRNLLTNLGIISTARAVGNNDIRFDIIGTLDDHIVVTEVDLSGSDTLNLPRYILDDIAVLHSRHNIEKEKIIPLLVINTFPNKRSDFYEVLTDIKNVTGIEVKTISLHYLLVLHSYSWRFSLDILKKRYFVHKDNPGIVDYTIPEGSGSFDLPPVKKLDPFFGSEFYQAIK